MTATTEDTMTTQPQPGDQDQTPEPLGPGWLTVTVVIGILAALIAVAGMILSFHAVSERMTPSFGPRWAWLVPLVVDLTVLVFSGVDLVLNRLAMSHPLARWTVYGATFGTVWLNYAAGGDAAGRLAHVLMPSVWVMFVELMRHVVRRTALRVIGTLREPIPAARWLLAPLPTFLLWRRMVLWRVNKYTAALAMERVRLNRIAAMRDEHGRMWRWRVSAATRLSINLGETEAPAPQSERQSGPQSSGRSDDQGEAQSAEQSRPQQSAPVAMKNQSALKPNQGKGARAPRTRVQAPQQNGDVLDTLTAAETIALDELARQCGPKLPSQSAIRSALPPGPDGKRCGATRAIRIQNALKARAESPDDPDPLADALDTEFAAALPRPEQAP